MIKDLDYNSAKAILTNAGSSHAEKTHPKHDGNCHDSYGQDLLAWAYVDFRKNPNDDEKTALKKACKKMFGHKDYDEEMNTTIIQDN